MERNGTPKMIKVAAQLDAELVEQIDQERRGRCSRADIVRMALHDRYEKLRRGKREVA